MSLLYTKNPDDCLPKEFQYQYQYLNIFYFFQYQCDIVCQHQMATLLAE